MGLHCGIIIWFLAISSALTKSPEEDDSFTNTAAERDAPLIKPTMTEITLDVNTDFQLHCEANELIIWQTTTRIYYEVTNYTTGTVKYGLTLHLKDVRGHDVGNFYCIKESFNSSDLNYNELIANKKASEVYIFVKDPKVFLVPIHNIFFTVHQYDTIEIPCKPTTPQRVVELISHDEVVLFNSAKLPQNLSSNNDYNLAKFDPKVGFTIRNVNNLGSMLCRSFDTKENITLNISIYRKTHKVAEPKIYSTTHGYALEGSEFKLTCEVSCDPDVFFALSWETPLDYDLNNKNRMVVSNSILKSNYVGQKNLTVLNAKISDGGKYICRVKDQSGTTNFKTYMMTIMKHNESSIIIRQPEDYYLFSATAGKTMQMSVLCKGFPNLTLNWYNPDGNRIEQNDKYKIIYSDNHLPEINVTLVIIETEATDTGGYTFEAKNSIEKKSLKFNVFIRDNPKVFLKDIYIQSGELAKIECKTIAFPKAKVIWSYTNCNIEPIWPTCENNSIILYSTREDSPTNNSRIEKIDELIFHPNKPGRIKCIANNNIGQTTAESYVRIGDLTERMSIYGVDKNRKLAVGDEVNLTCAVLAYYYSKDIIWFRNGSIIENDNGLEVSTSISNYSYKKSIKFKSIDKKHAGSYECRAKKINGQTIDSKFLKIIVHDPTPPVIADTNLNGEFKNKLGDSLEMICNASGIPKPSLIWFKDDEKINSSDHADIIKDDSVLRIKYIKPNHEGTYKCEASNRLGKDYAIFKLKITNMPGLKTIWIVGILVFIAILIIFIIYLSIRITKEREKLRQMKLAGLANFEEGDIEQINPTLSIDEQADLLPYDQRFEFPRDKLKLGKKLGAGAFGVVLKAHADGIIPGEKETVVAVKMVKRTADNEVIKALVSELKIMVHLGQHLNVVNLLGAVTKNILKREVMVIVEYCRFGNVQNFLLRNRKRFTNQINPITDKIDPSVIKDRFSAKEFEINRDGLKYAILSFTHQYLSNNNNHMNSETDPRSGTRPSRQNSSDSDFYESNMDSCSTEQTFMSSILENDDQILSNNSVQPAWRSNYKSDSSEAMTITTSDLVSWAFQVARGMDYLASRKVLHGDLAARNILLCEANIVKICDFGLARSMYRNENYMKQGESPLPIKWLALESLSDQIFSTCTDVWSFGIVLWEFFSLAKVPYPGMEAQDLFYKLKDGYRMEKPPYANNELYDIMLECWSANPESRPLFHELEKKFARLLGEEAANHYVDLNEPYLKINEECMKQRDTDYFASMGSPEEIAPQPPGLYVNGMIPTSQIDVSNDYLQMTPTMKSNMCSQSLSDDYIKPDNLAFTEQRLPTILNNPDTPVSKNHKIISLHPKKMSVLKKSNEIDEGSDTNSSDDLSEERAQISSTFKKMQTSLISNDDNYVNFRTPDQSKKFINGTKDAFSNPSYLMLKTINDGRK